jgi:hypothetical protein
MENTIMNAEVFAEWFRRQGHKVIQTESSYWVNFGPEVYQAFPYHHLISSSDKELNDLFKREKVIGLRFSTPIESNQGYTSYHVISNQKNYDISLLERRTRQNIRKGLTNCQVEQIPLSRLAKEGLHIIKDTVIRQKRHPNGREERWMDLCSSAYDLPGFEAWGALVDNVLAGFLLTFQMEDWCYFLYQYSLKDFLTARINNALCYTVTKNFLDRPQIKSILYSLESLDASDNVDEFKFRMGYVAKPVRQKILFHPWLQFAMNGMSCKVIDLFRRCSPHNSFLAKTEGMLRSYREQQNLIKTRKLIIDRKS